MNKEHEIIIQYTRQGKMYYDRYYSFNTTIEEAIEDIRKLWHNNNHLFPEARDARFFAEV